MWCNISILEVDDLDYLEYLRFRRDAYISMLRKTPEGRSYLKNAARLEIAQPDKDSIRKQFVNRIGEQPWPVT